MSNDPLPPSRVGRFLGGGVDADANSRDGVTIARATDKTPDRMRRNGTSADLPTE